jgi:hypothetical protein
MRTRADCKAIIGYVVNSYLQRQRLCRPDLQNAFGFGGAYRGVVEQNRHLSEENTASQSASKPVG